MKSNVIISIVLALGLCVGCSQPKASDDHFFQLRGIVLAWEDVVADPSIIDWLGTMKQTEMNTISIFGRDYQSPEYAELKQKCIDLGFEFEYEEHGMTWLLPRAEFAEHPEWFRMDENGNRVPDYNCCPSNPEALEAIRGNVKELADRYAPTNHRYYFWLHDGGDKCHCPECEKYNLADQALLIENTIIEALREFDPEAQLAHLAYDKTTPAPQSVKPEDGIFLEYAPIDRDHSRPLSDTWAIGKDGRTHATYIKALKKNIEVFGTEDAMVLEYWLDDSLFSNWDYSNLVEVPWDHDNFLDDVKTYVYYGIRNISCYAFYIDPTYVSKFGYPDCIVDYGNTLSNYKK